MSNEEKTTPTKKEVKFTVEQLLRSRRYVGNRDLLKAVLDPKKTYSHIEVKNEIEAFNKRDLSKGGK